MSPLQQITVSGSAAARGERHGREARDSIVRALGLYRALLEKKAIPWREALNTASGFVGPIENFDPDALIEIEAIAHASGCQLNEIVLLNARTELMYWYGQQRRERAEHDLDVDECTGVIVGPGASRDGRLLHAQNWDWMPEVARHTLVLRVRDHDGPNALHFVEAGQLARHGMNEAGIAVSAMGLHSDRDYGRLGVPSPVLRRKMVHSASLGETIAEVYDNDASFSHALFVSHAEGEAFAFESVPGGVHWLEPEDDLLVHANHFKSPDALRQITDMNLARCADSLHRDRRLRRLLQAGHGAIGWDELVEALADTAMAPDGILRAPSARRGGSTSATIYSLVMSPSERCAWVALQPWISRHYERISIE